MVSTLVSRRSPGSATALRRACACGFTLVELLITVSIVIILAMLAAPSVSELMASQRVQMASSDLINVLQRARSEAVVQNTDAVLSASGGAWTGGWTLVADGNTLDTHSAMADIAIAVNTSATSLTFRSSGRLTGAPPKFTISASGTTTKRCVSVALNGQPVTAKGACT